MNRRNAKIRMRGGAAALALAALQGIVWATETRAQALASPPAASTGAVAVASPVAAPAGTVSALSPHRLWESGDWTLWLLAFLGVVGLASGLGQLLALGEGRGVPRGLLAEVLERIRAGELGEARRLCEKRSCALSVVALQAFDHVRYAPRSGVLLLRDAVAADAACQTATMLSRVQVLREIAVLAPLIGLLGTVLAWRQTLLAAGSAALSPAGALAPALLPAVWGLAAAIPAAAWHFWMVRCARRRAAQLRAAAAEIALAMAERYDR